MLPRNVKRLLIFLGIPVFFVVGILVLGSSVNSLANRRARIFCDSVAVDDPVMDVLARAKHENIIHINSLPETKYIFIFNGFVFGHATCVVVVDKGLVQSKICRPVRD